MTYDYYSMIVIVSAVILLFITVLWIALALNAIHHESRERAAEQRQREASESTGPPSPASRFRLTAGGAEQDAPSVTYSGGGLWWLGFGAGLVAAAASGWVGGGGGPLGAAAAVALNPIVWFGVFSGFKIRRAVTCPHCQRSEPLSDEFRNAPLGSVGRCPHCQNPIRKGSQHSQTMTG